MTSAHGLPDIIPAGTLKNCPCAAITITCVGLHKYIRHVSLSCVCDLFVGILIDVRYSNYCSKTVTIMKYNHWVWHQDEDFFYK